MTSENYNFLTTPKDIELILGLALHGSYSDADLRSAAKDALTKNAFDEAHVRLAYNIIRDNYYREVFLHYGTLKSLWDSGFIDDELPIGRVLDLYSTSTATSDLAKLSIEATHDSRLNAIVLVATGAFAPVHDGHIIMLELARKTLVQLGFTVVGALICPEHDAYIKRKQISCVRWSGKERLKLINERVSQLPWIAADCWASACVPTEIMFTDVLTRTQKYLAVQTGVSNIQVAHVFGADNARQARAFLNYGLCVCINRHGSEVRFEQLKSELSLIKSCRAVFVDEAPPNIASTMVRAMTP